MFRGFAVAGPEEFGAAARASSPVRQRARRSAADPRRGARASNATASATCATTAHLWHVSTLPAEVAEYLLAEYGPEGVPRNAFHGDGSPIEDETVELIGRLYEENAVSVPWQRGDVLIVDNFLATHAREPFRGDRRTRRHVRPVREPRFPLTEGRPWSGKPDHGVSTYLS